MSKATKAQRAAAVKQAIEAARKGRASSAKLARDEVTDDQLIGIAAGEVVIKAGMTPELAATLADVERRAAKLVANLKPARDWGGMVNPEAYDQGVHKAKAAGAGREVGARSAGEQAMRDHIISWVERYGPKAPSKASREFQGLNPGRGCWPVYRRVWGEIVANPVEQLKGYAMTSKAATYADASFVTSFAEYVAAAVADERHEHHALAVEVAAGTVPVEVEAVEVEAPKAKAPRKAAPKAKAPKAAARKATPRKAAGQ